MSFWVFPSAIHTIIAGNITYNDFSRILVLKSLPEKRIRRLALSVLTFEVRIPMKKTKIFI